MFPPKLRPGQMPTASEVNDLARAVYDMGMMSGTGAQALTQGSGSLITRDYSPDTIFARITGAPTGAAYPFVEVARNDDGTYSDLGGWFQQGTAADTPAVENAGRTDVPVNAIVSLTMLPGGGGWGFDYGAAGGVWSKTSDGILTASAQTGGGTKTCDTGVDSSRGGWQAAGAQVAGDSKNTGWFPYFAAYTATSPIPGGVFGVTIRPIAAGDLTAPAGGAQSLVTLFGTIASAKTVYMSFMSVTATGLAPSTTVIAAGDEPSSANLTGFGVVRVGGVLVGIDRDMAIGDRPIVRGGIIVGYNNP